jgi:hypothetical protein
MALTVGEYWGLQALYVLTMKTSRTLAMQEDSLKKGK